jgi:hypothetical protein
LEEVGWVGLKKVPYSGHSYNLIDFDWNYEGIRMIQWNCEILFRQNLCTLEIALCRQLDFLNWRLPSQAISFYRTTHNYANIHAQPSFRLAKTICRYSGLEIAHVCRKESPWICAINWWPMIEVVGIFSYSAVLHEATIKFTRFHIKRFSAHGK